MQRFLNKFVLSIVVGVLMISLVACGNNEEKNKGEKAPTGIEEKEEQPKPTEQKATPTSTEKTTPGVKEPTPIAKTKKEFAFKCEKIASIDLTEKKYGTTSNFGDCKGIPYITQDGIGFITLDGTVDTGARFNEMGSRYDELGDFGMRVSSKEQEDDTIESMNRYGILSYDGEVIIPEEYYDFQKMNSKYLVAFKVTEQVESDAEYMIRSYPVGINANSGDNHYYKGEWQIFDGRTGTPVPGAKGTNPQYVPNECAEGIAKYVTDDGIKHIINVSGEEISLQANIFSDGTYEVADVDISTVYNNDGTVKFTYDPNEYSLEYVHGTGNSEGALFAVFRKAGGEKTYARLDETGKIISARYLDVQEVLGPFVTVGGDGVVYGYLYDMDGNKVIDEEIKLGRSRVASDDFGNFYAFVSTTEDIVYCVDYDGNIVFDGSENSNGVSFNSDGLLWRRTVNDLVYYNFAESEFNIQRASHSDHYISFENAGGRADLMDAFTGNTILRGYDHYEIKEKDDVVYILGSIYDDGVTTSIGVYKYTPVDDAE